MAFEVPESYRVRRGPMGSDPSYGNNGAFQIPLATGVAVTIASDGHGWEHVSVSFPDRTPTWAEMDQIKALFWGPEDVVVQYHPPESARVNCQPYALHLWRPTEGSMPAPPDYLVGPREARP